ncbi:hypothetical protein GCM10029978_099950 [Actinoallomurus acanthiterrae]
MFAATATAVEKCASCQPAADSPENVTVASLVPSAAHRVPVCVPVLPGPL